MDFAESRIADQSAIEAINKLADRYHQAGKTLHLRHLSSDCIRLIRRAEQICEVNVLEDPDYFVAIDVMRQDREDRAAQGLEPKKRKSGMGVH